MAIFIGSTFPGNKTGPLYYRDMLRKKDDSLKSNNENFNTKIKLKQDALFEAEQWKRNIFTVFKPIKNPKLTKTI